MAYYFLHPNKDTTIYSHPHRTDLNTGRTETLALASEKGTTDDSYYPSRILIQFDDNEISNVYHNKVLPHFDPVGYESGSFNVGLKLYATDYDSELPTTQSIELYPIADSWNNGTQRYVDNPYYLGIKSDGASWLYIDNGIDKTLWDIPFNSYSRYITPLTKYYFENSASLSNYLLATTRPPRKDIYVNVNRDETIWTYAGETQEHALYYSTDINTITGSLDRLNLTTFYGKSFGPSNSFLQQKDLIFTDAECTEFVASGSYLRQGNNIFEVGESGSISFNDINLDDTPRGLVGRRIACYMNVSVSPLGGIDSPISPNGGDHVAVQLGTSTDRVWIWCPWWKTEDECCQQAGGLSSGQVFGIFNPQGDTNPEDVDTFTGLRSEPTIIPNIPAATPLIISGLVGITEQGIPVWDTSRRAEEYGLVAGFTGYFNYNERGINGYIAGIDYQSVYETSENYSTFVFIDNDLLNHLNSDNVVSRNLSNNLPSIPYVGSYNWISIPDGGGSWYTGEGFEARDTIDLTTDLDLNFDVTSLIHKFISGYSNKPYPDGIPNNGFIIKRENDTINTGSYQSTLKYFGLDTHTIFSPTLAIKWDDSIYDTGSATPEKILSSGPIQLNFSNLKPEYRQEEEPILRLNVRKQYPDRTFATSSNYLNVNHLTSASYYSIEDYTSKEVIVPFDTNFTKLSADSEGMYFKLHMNGLQPERYYRLLVRHDNNDGINIYDEDWYFKVVR